MQLDKTKGYIFRIKDVEQAKAVVDVLVSQGYKLSPSWRQDNYLDAVYKSLVVDGNSINDYILYNPTDSNKNTYTWVDTEMFLEYSLPTKVKETIQVGDTIFDKEEFQQATAHLKGVKV